MFSSSDDPGSEVLASRSRSARVARISLSVRPGEALVEDDCHVLHRFGRQLGRDFHEDRPHRAAAQRQHEQQLLGRNL